MEKVKNFVGRHPFLSTLCLIFGYFAVFLLFWLPAHIIALHFGIEDPVKDIRFNLVWVVAFATWGGVVCFFSIREGGTFHWIWKQHDRLKNANNP